MKQWKQKIACLLAGIMVITGFDGLERPALVPADVGLHRHLVPDLCGFLQQEPLDPHPDIRGPGLHRQIAGAFDGGQDHRGDADPVASARTHLTPPR